MERIKSMHGLTDDEMFSYFLRLDALADIDSLRSSALARPALNGPVPRGTIENQEEMSSSPNPGIVSGI